MVVLGVSAARGRDGRCWPASMARMRPLRSSARLSCQFPNGMKTAIMTPSKSRAQRVRIIECGRAMFVVVPVLPEAEMHVIVILAFLGIVGSLGSALFYLMRDNGESDRSEEHTSELQSPMRTSYAVFC